MSIHTRETLLIQFKGHPAEPFLRKRQELVDRFMTKYPLYFDHLSEKCQGLLDDDKLRQLRYGNTGLVVHLPEIFQTHADETPEGIKFNNLCKQIQTTQKGILALKDNIDRFLVEAKSDWEQNGNSLENFDLVTFVWSQEKLDSFTKKEGKSKDPKTIRKLRDIVIPIKKKIISEKTQEFQQAEQVFHQTQSMKQVKWLQDYLNLYPEYSCVYQATVRANEMLSRGDSSDGGFELDVVNDPKVLAQWWTELQKRMKRKLLQQGRAGHRRGLRLRTNELKFYPNLYYVVRHQKGKKIWYQSAEQDLIIYDPIYHQVIARGEIKRSYDDLAGADYQHRRDFAMLFGKSEHAFCTTFSEYQNSETVVDRYLAEKGKFETPIFTQKECQRLLEQDISFIITTPPSTGGKVRVPSKVMTQMTHWIFSSRVTPESYIQQKNTELLEGLHYRDLTTIRKERDIFVVDV